MGVLIKQQVGFQSDQFGNTIEVALPQDEIYLTGNEYPAPKRVGFVLREKGAAINLHAVVSESDEAAIRKAVADRDCDGGDPQRELNNAPPIKSPDKKK